MKLARRGGKGQLLILVLGIMAIGMLVIAPLLAYVDLSLRLSLRSHGKTAGYYAAEAGVHMAIGDLYVGQDIMDKTYTGEMNNYKFISNVSPAYGTAPQDVTEAYFDPGVSMALRPLASGDTHEYSLVALKGKALKISWAAYTNKDATNKSAWDFNSGTTEDLNTLIELFDSDGNPVASKRASTDERHASDQARLIANTLYVPGEDIEGGTYTVRFTNEATRAGNPAYSCSQHFSRDADELFVFNGTIKNTFTGGAWHNCSDFFSAGGEVTLLAINEDQGDATGQVNTFSFFCDFVQLNVTSLVEGNTTVTTYNYSQAESGMGGNRSYTGALNVSSGGTLGQPGNAIYHSPSWYGGEYFGDDEDRYATNVKDRIPFVTGFTHPSANFSEMTNDQYLNISAADGARVMATDPRPVNKKNACTWHVFTIDENPSDVIQLDIHWEGYQTRAAPAFLWYGTVEIQDDDDLYLLMWNYAEDANSDGLDGKYHILDKKQANAGFTWIKIAQGGYADYLITSTSYKDENDNDAIDEGEEVVMVTCYLIQVPGPSIWWEEQYIDIVSWNVHLYPGRQ